MRIYYKSFISLVVLVASIASLKAQSNYLRISATEAKKHIHEIATVYGKLSEAASYYNTDNPSQATRKDCMHNPDGVIFDVDGKYPNQPFNIVLKRPGSLEILRRSKRLEGIEIEATGRIATNDFTGVPEIIITSVSEIVLVKAENVAVDPPEVVEPAPAKKQEDFSPNQSQSAQGTVSNQTSKFPSWFKPRNGATNTIRTIRGLVLEFAQVAKFEPDGLGIEYNGGFAYIKIPFEDLPASYQQEYGYNPQRAIAYINAQKQAEVEMKIQEAKQELAKKTYEAERAKKQAALAKQQYDEEIRLQTLQAQQKAAAANERAANAADRQAEITRRQAIIQQIQKDQQLLEMERQTQVLKEQAVQQARTADGIDQLKWQIQYNSYSR